VDASGVLQLQECFRRGGGSMSSTALASIVFCENRFASRHILRPFLCRFGGLGIASSLHPNLQVMVVSSP
jgi:hypothetical protein